MINRLKNLSKLQRVLVYVAAFFLGALILLLLFKGLLFQWVLNSQIAKINARSSYHISIQDSELKGISKAGMFGLLVQSQNGDSLVFIETLHAGIRPLSLISGKHLIRSIELHNGFARYERRKSAQIPSDSLEKKEDITAEKEGEELPYKIYHLFQRYFPSEMSITHFQLSYSDSLGPVHVLLDSIVSNKDMLNATVLLSDKHNKQTWHFQGSMHDGVNLLATAEEKAPLPALYQRFGVDFRSDTIRFALENKGLGADGFGLHLSGSINGLELFHPKLSSDTIGFDYLATEMDLSFANSQLRVDTNSSFVINAIHGTFGLHAPLSR
ncbi:MAG: AsmA family protein, partial [Bacteroidia bacterium]